MSPTEHFANSDDGTVIVAVRLPQPWPPLRELLISEMTGEQTIFSLHATPEGRMRAVVMNTNGDELLAAASCVLQMQAPTDAIVAVSWSLADSGWSMYINGQMIGADVSQDVSVPTVYIPARKPATKSTETFDAANREAIRRRRDRFAGWQPIPRRVPGTPADIRAALEDEIAQVRDLLGHLKEGKLYHVRGLSARLRMLVATGAPLPVLQLFAAVHDLPLVAYTNAKSEWGLNEPDAFAWSLSIGGAADPRLSSPVDIDVWLNLPGAQIRDHVLTHRQILKAVGDTIGAHYDNDALPLVRALRASQTELHGLTADMMVLFLGELAMAVIAVAERALSAVDSVQQATH